MLAVNDVEASSRWYQRLFGCTSGHGGTHYERLIFNGNLVLQLHGIDVEDHHGVIADKTQPLGNGPLIWFEVDDFDALVERAHEMGMEILLDKHCNPPDRNGGPNHWEIWMKDPEGYKVVAVSPDGTADGDWKP